MLITGVFRERIRKVTGRAAHSSEDTTWGNWTAFLRVVILVKFTWQDLCLGKEAWWMDENDEGLSSGRCVSPQSSVCHQKYEKTHL